MMISPHRATENRTLKRVWSIAWLRDNARRLRRASLAGRPAGGLAGCLAGHSFAGIAGMARPITARKVAGTSRQKAPRARNKRESPTGGGAPQRGGDPRATKCAPIGRTTVQGKRTSANRGCTNNGGGYGHARGDSGGTCDSKSSESPRTCGPASSARGGHAAVACFTGAHDWATRGTTANNQPTDGHAKRRKRHRQTG